MLYIVYYLHVFIININIFKLFYIIYIIYCIQSCICRIFYDKKLISIYNPQSASIKNTVRIYYALNKKSAL